MKRRSPGSNGDVIGNRRLCLIGCVAALAMAGEASADEQLCGFETSFSLALREQESGAVADLDGDGVPDVVTATAGVPLPSSVSVMLGNGDARGMTCSAPIGGIRWN